MAEEQKTLNLVMYPDGGCRGEYNAGSGCHGYTWSSDDDNDSRIKSSGLKKDTPTSHGYVDDNNQAALDNHKAFQVTPLEYIDHHCGLPNGTNNIGELEGAIFALKTAVSLKVKQLVLIPDSTYVIDGISKWLPGWLKRNWTNSAGIPIKNIEYWQRIAGLIEELKAQGTVVTIYWVNGHSNNLGNDEADRQATKGVILASKGSSTAVNEFRPARGYWNYKAEYNRMIFQPHWYFATQTQRSNRTPDGRAIYYAGHHSKEDDFFMKRSSDAYVSVLYLKEPEPVLEMISQYQEAQETGNYGSIYIGYLTNILNSRTYSELRDNGNQYCWVGAPKPTMSYIDTLLTTPMRPALMSWCADTVFNNLQGILNEFEVKQLATKDNVETNTTPIETWSSQSEICVTDLTSRFYEIDVTKKKEVYKLTPEISQTTKSIKVELDHNVTGTPGKSMVILTLGLDMPNRNALSAIASSDARIYGVTWRESPHGFRYATVVCSGGDTCITAAMYANLIAIAK